jgi:magnesium chelatase family protein
MNLAVVHSRASAGIQALPVMIEVHLSKGLPGFSIVGLPETAVKESRHRVRSAVVNSGFEFPVRRITVNLAPADLPKEGGRFDLPIALGILAASEQIPAAVLAEYEILGELALSGEVRACQGILPFAIAAHKSGRRLIVPLANIDECLLVKGLAVYGVAHLTMVCAHLADREPLAPATGATSVAPAAETLDLSQVKGQAHARRALEVAAAGGHSLLMIGAPGSGKTMLASRLPSILPPMTEDEALEVAAVYSMSRQGFDYRSWQRRPFRGPHHSASNIALVGGGNPPHPGEISLAHHGVLFLDELPEFSRAVLEALREPLEAGCVSISRAGRQETFPAVFQLIAAMNPCPCGYYGQPKQRCRCTVDQVRRYQQKISGPLLDRIDMQVMVQALSPDLLLSTPAANESSVLVRQRVCQIQEIQRCRQKKLNAALTSEEISFFCSIGAEDQAVLSQAIDLYGLSARSYHRILKLARTIADLERSDGITSTHLYEAMGFRNAIKSGTI